MDLAISQTIKPYSNPTIWQKVVDLTQKTKSIDLSQGTPQIGPPNFFIKNLQKAASQNCYEQCDPRGISQLRKTIMKFHERQYKTLDWQKNIGIFAGASAALYFTFMAFLNPGDQVILFEPAFDFYRHYATLCKANTQNVLLYSAQTKTQEQVKEMIESKTLSECKNWQIDWAALQSKLTQKVKIIVLNSPHNPTGKIFTQEQIDWICQLALGFPNLVIIQDCVYEGFMFDEFKGKFLPKTIHSKYYKQLKNRIIQIQSAGKLLQATGIRVGWLISDENTVKTILKLHQVALYNVSYLAQKATTYCLNDIIMEKFYYINLQAQRLQHHRQELLKVLINSKYNFLINIPKSGYFILVDISQIEVKEKYYFYQLQGQEKNTKDLAFCYQMAIQDGVVIVPCSTFFCKQNIQEKYVRFAFCKKIEVLKQAGQKLKLKKLIENQTIIKQGKCEQE